jgi:hypothetical protein
LFLRLSANEVLIKGGAETEAGTRRGRDGCDDGSF